MDQMDIMVTRGKRVDYFVLNDGSDEEAPLEDRLNNSQPQDSADSLPDSEIFPLSQPQQLSLHRRFQMKP
ncbi:hypothetical protein V1524DRAFT_441232 [Lipomyces starkeyi]